MRSYDVWSFTHLGLPCLYIHVLCSSCSYCTFTASLPIDPNSGPHSAFDPSDLWWKDSGARACRDPSRWRLTTWPSSPLAWIKDPQSPLCSFTIAPCARPPTSTLPWQLTTVCFICWGRSLCYYNQMSRVLNKVWACCIIRLEKNSNWLHYTWHYNTQSQMRVCHYTEL